VKERRGKSDRRGEGKLGARVRGRDPGGRSLRVWPTGGSSRTDSSWRSKSYIMMDSLLGFLNTAEFSVCPRV